MRRHPGEALPDSRTAGLACRSAPCARMLLSRCREKPFAHRVRSYGEPLKTSAAPAAVEKHLAGMTSEIRFFEVPTGSQPGTKRAGPQCAFAGMTVRIVGPTEKIEQALTAAGS